MGRIFSWEEIEQGKVPRLESFKEVTQKLRKELASNKKVVVALLCGSALRGDYSIRSDIDCFVIYSDGVVFSDLRKLVAYAKRLSVPLEMIPVNIRMVGIDFYLLKETSFLHHLEWAAKQGGIVKGETFSILKIMETDRKEMLKSTVTTISTKLHRALCELSRFEGEKRIFNLGKILEAPIQMVREIVWARKIPIPSQGKEEVLKAYWTIADEKSRHLLDEVVRVDKEYSATLEKVSRQPDPAPYKEEYTRILGRIEEIGQNEILEFVVHNAQLLNQTI